MFGGDVIRHLKVWSDSPGYRFLGPRMIYTSGIISDANKDETLEQLQDNKLTVVCEKLDLQPTDTLLDIGSVPLCLRMIFPELTILLQLRMGYPSGIRWQKLRLRRHRHHPRQEPDRLRQQALGG